VIKRISGVLLFLVMLQSALGLQSAAQLPPSCMANHLWYVDDGPIPVGWFFCSSYPGTFASLICAMTCPPSPPCRNCKSPKASQPISLATGETYIEQTDIRIPGLGGGLSLQRTWTSTWPSSLPGLQTGMFGPNWRSTYEEKIVMGINNFLQYIRGDATFWSFGTRGSLVEWVATGPARSAVTLNTDTSSNPYFTLTFQDGEQHRFDKTTGNLIAIIDRNGNTTTVAYDSSGRLSTVTDAASRSLTFNYTGNSSLASSVSSSVGISLSYSYDNQGRLTQVTKPDQTTVSFTYNSQSLITAVTDSNGKTLESHTYDSNGRGLTGSRANGVEAVTISYPH
jgi:YD repeat-containing protein